MSAAGNTVSIHLAFDFGAESGRGIVGTLDSGRLSLRESARFPNGNITVDGHLHWDINRLFSEVRKCLKACAAAPPDSVGVDTWGVDFGLLDAKGELLGPPFAYRDRRTDGAMESFFRKMPPEKLYSLTGIQFMQLNTVFQLESMVRDRSPLLGHARSLLFMPDLFHWMLTGIRRSELTFATTSQLFNPVAGKWAPEIVSALGISPGLLQDIVRPGTVLGPLSAETRAATGLPSIQVAAVGTHDTASAVAAAPGEGDDWAYLSSGTWSLLGLELPAPVITRESRALNFTNEGGVDGTTRFLKNIMGLWLIQECRRTWARDRDYTYPELVALAEASPPFASLVDPDRPGFLNPPDMPEAIRAECRRTGQPEPVTPGAMARCVFESLALKYKLVLEQAEKLSRRKANRLHVIGGGSQNRLLNQFTANACGIPVLAGPAEATAIGNILVQARALGRLSSLADIRKVVLASFPPGEYQPCNTDIWNEAYMKFKYSALK